MEYGAITVDINFWSKRFIARVWATHALVQFNNKPVNLHWDLSLEKNAYLIKKVNDSYAQLDKSLNNAKKHILGMFKTFR